MGNYIENKVLGLLSVVERKGMGDLMLFLENKSDFFTAPCSSQYHLCNEGGLAQHSLNVFNFANDSYRSCKYIKNGVINEDSIKIVALLHDLGKANYRGKAHYVPNLLKSGKLSTSKPYETNKDRLTIPHEVVSLQIASKFIELTEEEEFAILYHNGMYVASGRDISGKERPLQQLLHFADMWCSRFLDSKGGE